MKKLFWLGITGLTLFEIANVYFIMPMAWQSEDEQHRPGLLPVYLAMGFPGVVWADDRSWVDKIEG